MQQTPAIPPRPVRGQDKDEATAAPPRIPPRPKAKGIDRSLSPNPDRFAPSPFNEGIPQKSPKALRFSPNHAVHEHGDDPIDRSGSVPMPSIGQEGVEYSAVADELRAEEEATGEKQRAASPEQTRTVAEDLKLHAPRPSLPAHSAKQRVQAVTRTDSDKAASFGIGRPGSRDGYKKKPSSSFSASEGRPEIEDEQGIPEIGQRVPMNPHLGDVQAPSPAPGSEEFKKHHHRKHSSRGGPPGSYGMHGHGVAPQDKLDKEYYEKHPEVLKREHQTPLHDRQNDYAMSSNDLNKLVRETRSRGSALGTGDYHSTPTDEVGFQASEEYTSRISSPRPVSTSGDKPRALSFKSEVTGPDGEKTVHVDDPKHPEYRSYGDEEAAVDDEDQEYTAPILASDEVSKDDRPYIQQPAVHPPPDRRGSAGEMEEPTSRPLSRTSRPSSIYKNNDSQEFEPTPLDDVKEYEPLFPEEAKKESEKPAPAEGNKARHYFPSKDVWEDAPESVHYTVEVSTPDEPEKPQRRSSAADRPKTPAHIFAQKHEELAEREARGPADLQPPKAHEKPIWTESQESDSFLNKQTRPTVGQRFPSRDVWEDVPESQLYEATVSESPKEESKPEISVRPAKKPSEDRPAVPERPKPKHTPSDEGKPRPPVSDKPKPQLPPRPTKSSSGDSKDGESKPKPPVPSRPVGGKIAALQAGFMSDLNKRLQLGPHAPKKEEPKPQEDLSEEKEKAPLSDARKGRARGPQRRAPARSPAAPVSEPVESVPSLTLTFSVPQTLWAIDPEGSLEVSGESYSPTPDESPVPEQETKVEEIEEPVEAPAPSVPEESEAKSEAVEVPTDPNPATDEPKPTEEPAQAPAQDADKPEEKEAVKEEKTLAANTAGESILETTVEKKESGNTVEPVEVSDEVKQ
ncbi:hypothetical protein ACJ41O_008562 [Fusarium nematophilum]